MNEYYDADNNFIGVNREFITVNKGDVHEIVKHYGAPKQKNKAVEELLELSEVLIKDVNKNDKNLDGIYEEMAEPTQIACPKCGKRIYKRTDITLACYPPKHQYFCEECDWVGSA